MIPILQKAELQSFTNKFNPERLVPQLSLFSSQGSLLCQNALPEMLTMRKADEILNTWRFWLNNSEGHDDATAKRKRK